ncbi:t58 [Tupaiid betaherpesvirus 1]|uniref:T58 n=1 Tax=Tupaiid herpesvirus 1 (strain 1) TaxID=10397 RepID=Q91TN4_TUHV1|nr:t58 [Tupaiid betaherpesvirus 1]AAK57107.1 t58 [Tupaiid betaherpesvirus 1]
MEHEGGRPHGSDFRQHAALVPTDGRPHGHLEIAVDRQVHQQRRDGHGRRPVAQRQGREHVAPFVLPRAHEQPRGRPQRRERVQIVFHDVPRSSTATVEARRDWSARDPPPGIYTVHTTSPAETSAEARGGDGRSRGTAAPPRAASPKSSPQMISGHSGRPMLTCSPIADGETRPCTRTVHRTHRPTATSCGQCATSQRNVGELDRARENHSRGDHARGDHRRGSGAAGGGAGTVPPRVLGGFTGTRTRFRRSRT